MVEMKVLKQFSYKLQLTFLIELYPWWTWTKTVRSFRSGSFQGMTTSPHKEFVRSNLTWTNKGMLRMTLIKIGSADTERCAGNYICILVELQQIVIPLVFMLLVLIKY